MSVNSEKNYICNFFHFFIYFFLAFLQRMRYNKSMRTTFTEYISKNGIRYHSSSIYQPDEADTMNPETHFLCEIFLLLSGSVAYWVEGKSYTLQPMEMLILAPNELHSLKIDTSQPYERMFVHFSPDLLPSLKDIDLFAPLNYAKYSARIIPRSFVEKFQLHEYMYMFKQLCSQKDKYLDLQLVGAIIKLIEALNKCTETILSLEPLALPTPETVNKLSSTCIQYINSHLFDQISAKDLANHLNISVSHIQNSFKKEIGIPLHRYILIQKMTLAHTLLSQGQSPQQVANMLGYEYYSTFYQTYMKFFLTKPKNYFKSSHQNLWGIENE